MKTDVVIVGGGPAGSTAAMYLSKKGVRTVIVEKERFPRYHIGESMTGECGGVVRDLGLEPHMLKHKHPAKQGVIVYGQQGKNSWWVPVMARDEAGHLQEQITWQVRRSDFDEMMLAESQQRGATLLDGQATRPLRDEDGTVRGVEVRTPSGKVLDIHADMVLDCSGQATFLANAGVTGPKYVGNYDKQLAIYSQISGARRDPGTDRMSHPDNTLIFYKDKYHWGWFIPLDEDVVSVGIVAPGAYYLSQKESKRDYLARELCELNPALSWRVEDIQFVEDARANVNYSYQVRDFAGPGYLCLGDAHRFLDPIFSFGLYVAMKEAQMASDTVLRYLDGEGRDDPQFFTNYMVYMEKGLDVLEDALDAFWENPFAFAYIVHSRYVDQMIDVFAGRIYENQPSRATNAFRKVLGRERTYDEDGLYSVPIGSRYNPEGARLWDPKAALVDPATLI